MISTNSDIALVRSRVNSDHSNGPWRSHPAICDCQKDVQISDRLNRARWGVVSQNGDRCGPSLSQEQAFRSTGELATLVGNGTRNASSIEPYRWHPIRSAPDSYRRHGSLPNPPSQSCCRRGIAQLPSYIYSGRLTRRQHQNENQTVESNKKHNLKMRCPWSV